MKSRNAGNGYSLLDSGGGRKLERFGEKVIVRPSSQCIWKTRLSSAEWRAAHAEFIPSGKQGEGKWRFTGDQFETWRVEVAGAKLELRLQTNGQVGIFPEHASYLPEVVKFIASVQQRENRAASVLNLFAYTGLASVVCLKQGAKVCHVDLSKKALTWANNNFLLNDLKDGKFRLIADDALKFLEREVSRENRYDIVIADPPSFSRTAKNSYWEIEDILEPLVRFGVSLLSPTSGLLVLTCHDPGISAEALRNIVMDQLNGKKVVFHAEELGLHDSASRILPSGSLAMARYGR